jgi:hypothetical protein
MPQAFAPILALATSANTYTLTHNCYYCTVAALNNMTVEEFFRVSEIMQQDNATPDEIVDLWKEGGVPNVAYHQFLSGDTFDRQVVQAMPRNYGLGLAYTRADGTGHMVVLAKDMQGIVKCVDYQHDPPTLSDFPPEPNITSVHVFYKTP